ncbi:PDZ and LIM domain protein 5b isoform X1 [Periophthalmus magnuspinnatus]|uniref:PDZ and LIM domain protein 5b isoform X1 n=1 Tax=Periophthalmus magnuspinnatus TaxID=409849 RepID=UPI00145AE23D|nr:PDZ and LIM domain protein 5b isoform X1 [Periophthalmus magnuspinnatus]
MSCSYSVSLVGPAPWGFRLQGGKDFCLPLTVSRVSDGGKAAKAKVSVGDLIVSINGVSTDGMTHLEAQNKIKASTDQLSLTLQKLSAASTNAAPKVEVQEIIKPVPIAHAAPPAAAATKTPAQAGPACNQTPRPFGVSSRNAASPKVASIPSESSAFTPAAASSSSSSSSSSQPGVYNSPINLYSSSNACEVTAPRRSPRDGHGVSDHVNGKPADPQMTQGGSPVSDASKKRLIEDTEDWHPRTGTSQSRSFRILAQMTGTESEQTPETSGKKESVDSSLHVSPAAKTFSKTAPSPRNGNVAPAPTFKSPGPHAAPAAGFSKTGPVPSFGKVTGPGAKGPAGPAPQPHPQDSLVQRAEHMPAAARTPVCHKCNNIIRGPFLVALGKSWHPEEFNCDHCRSSLAENGFVEEKGGLYCAHCYETMFAPTCFQCQQKILGKIVNALKQTFHASCFVCVACHQPIGGNAFHMEDGQPYCEQDYYSLFGNNCHGCDFPIEAGDKFIEALGFTWHDTCFVCTVCCASLEGQPFFSKKDKPLCKTHAHSVNI